jgi:hypothetical protein
VSGPDADGNVDVTVSWSFKNTDDATERLITRRYVNDNNTGGSDTIPVGPQGTHTFRHNTACWRPGTYPVWASMRACNREKETPQQAYTVAETKPTVNLTVSEKDPETGIAIATVSWDFAGATDPAKRSVYVRWHNSNGIVWQPPASMLPLPRSGNATFQVSCTPGADTHIVGVAVACERDKAETDPQAIPECENACGGGGSHGASPGSWFKTPPSLGGQSAGPIGEVCCVGAPIRLTNGNMRMTDHDALGGDGFAPRQRTYDSRRRSRGWFGPGWGRSSTCTSGNSADHRDAMS